MLGDGSDVNCLEVKCVVSYGSVDATHALDFAHFSQEVGPFRLSLGRLGGELEDRPYALVCRHLQNLAANTSYQWSPLQRVSINDDVSSSSDF